MPNIEDARIIFENRQKLEKAHTQLVEILQQLSDMQFKLMRIKEVIECQHTDLKYPE